MICQKITIICYYAWIKAQQFIFKSNNSKDYKYSLIKEYIDSKHSIFKIIDISNINIDNVWDWLEIQKEKYGNEFIMISLI